jgi:hypothetical protein
MHGFGTDFQIIQFGGGNPADIRCIVTGTDLTSDNISYQIDNNIMKTGTRRSIYFNVIEGIDRLPGPDGYTGFLKNFALSRFLQGFA